MEPQEKAIETSQELISDVAGALKDKEASPAEQIKKWKLLALLFAGLFIGSLLTNFIPPFAIPYSALKDGNLLALSDSSWVKINEPLFNGFILTDKNCAACNPQRVEQILRSGLSPTIQIKIVDVNDELGKKLSANFEVSSLPMIFFDETIKKLKNFSALEPLLTKKASYYNLDISTIGMAPDIFYNKPKIDNNHPVIGSESSPLTIFEFIDYQCPFCKKFADETLPQIKTNYIDKNKIRLVFKDFPLDFHQNAVEAAKAARCANAQNKFLAMHNLLFKEQPQWSNLDSAKAENYFINLAAKLNLNIQLFRSCFKSEAVKNAILEDLREGKEVFKVSGTPGFLIGNQGVSGALPYAEFEKIIEQQFNQTK